MGNEEGRSALRVKKEGRREVEKKGGGACERNIQKQLHEDGEKGEIGSA